MTTPGRTNLAAGREIVAIPGPSVMPDRVLNAMHRAMPDIYAGELTELIDEVFDTLPTIARTTARAFVPIESFVMLAMRAASIAAS